MINKNTKSKIAAVLSAVTLMSACGEGLKQGKKVALPTVSKEHEKWLELSKALKLPDSLEQPSEYLKPENQEEYTQLVFEAAGRMNQTAYASRCAAIDSFAHHSETIAKDNAGNEIEADVYLLGYKLQANFAGEAEQHTRHGIVTVPRKTGQYPFAAFGHGGDKGLSYDDLASYVGKMQESHIVIAPTFPGEKLLGFGDIDPVGKSVPWINDVDELLGMHDCLASYTQHKSTLAMFAGAGPLEVTAKELIASIESFVPKSTSETLDREILSKTKFYNGLNAFKNYPESVLVGASRGGLVASLAAAKAGSALASLQLDPSAFKSLFDFNKPYITEKVSLALRKQLGSKYGATPPAFKGLATIAAPATVTIGKFRIILEHMVKGNLHLTSAAKLPGMKDLTGLFDAYLAGDQSAEEAKFEIILRDITFLAPLMIAELKDWAVGYTPGSILFLHGKQDSIVPLEQTQAAYNILQGMAENKSIKEKSLSPFGLNFYVRIFDRNADSSSESVEGSFHFDEGFYKSKSLLPKDFILMQSQNAYFDQQETELEMFRDSNLAATKKAASVDDMKAGKEANLRDAFAYFSAEEIMPEDVTSFDDDNLKGIFEISSNRDEFPSEFAERKDLQLMLNYVMTNGSYSAALASPLSAYEPSLGGNLLTPIGLSTDFKQVVKKEHSSRDGSDYYTLYEDATPSQALEAWGRLAR